MNPCIHPPLPIQMASQLNAYRNSRAFSPSFYLKAKLKLLNRYFKKTHLSAAVIGVSGGIDSAVTLAILKRLQDSNQSCLKKIIPLCLPFYDCDGATDQDMATQRAIELVKVLGMDTSVLDLTPVHNSLYQCVNKTFNFTDSAWSQGQLVSNLRTPVFYQIANQLHEQGFSAAVIGTINRDEGAFIGFFGKASDAMVDIQCISDIHKSEVYQLARYLNIPESIINSPPTGNTYDGALDELSFGFSYDFLEWYSYYLNMSLEEQESLVRAMDEKSRSYFETYAEFAMQRHNNNRHKYFIPPQGLHFDVYDKSVPGGWDPERNIEKQIDLSTFHNLFVLKNESLTLFKQPNHNDIKIKTILPYVHQIEHLLTGQEILFFRDVLKNQEKAYADIHGKPSCYGQQYRCSTYNPALAEILFERLEPLLEPYLFDDGYQPIDGGKDTVWKLAGLSPLFRFIAYTYEGELVGHYDEGYQDGKQKTLYSLLIYLTSQQPESGGETVILLDPERNKPLSERSFPDDVVPFPPADILHTNQPEAGNGLLLAHRIRHGVTKNLSSEDRIVIRLDIVYESLGPDFPDEKQALPKESYPSVMNDRFYKNYFLRTKSLDQTIAAGFIDNATISYQSPWPTLPLHKLMQSLANEPVQSGQEYVVLLTTGGFCPIHEEHLVMMQKARETLEAEGKKVIAGFISPSHQDYIQSKSAVTDYCSRKHINTLIDSVSNSSWLDVWLWEYLEHKKPINFTDVILRLEKELALHIKTTIAIKVAYVFGGDNARFHYAFLDRGLSVCVERAGAETQEETIRNSPLIKGNENIYFVKNDSPLFLSSEKIRQKKQFTSGKKCQIFYLRTDEIFYKHWIKNRPGQSLLLNGERFLSEFVELIQTTYTKHIPEFKIEIISAVQQIAEIRNALSNKAILSLDPCYEAEFNLGVSRYFRFGLPDIKLGFGARPESEPLELQISKLPKQSYCLVDDDSFTGETLNYAKQLLQEEYPVNETCLAMSSVCNGSTIEIGDFRDFIVGANFGGLVMVLPDNRLARVPYLYPFILPSQRIQCPTEDNLSFSLAVWKLNLEFYSTDKELLIKHCDTPFIHLTEYLGFSSQCSLYDFCNYYIRHLTQLNEDSNDE
jgi:NAD+ synthetase